MSHLPPFEDPEMGEDPELLAALAAAFGDDGKDLLADLPATETETSLALSEDSEESQPAEECSVDSLSNLISRLDQAIATLGETQAEVNDAPTEPIALNQEHRYVVFQTGEQLAAIALSGIAEIDRLPAYTALPHTPAWCLGIANLRGQIVSVTDLAELVGGASHSAVRDRRVMIVRSQKFAASTALVVDRVIGIRSFGDTRIERPEDLDSRLAKFAPEIASIGHDQVMLIDPDLLMQHPEMQPFMQD